MRRRFTTSSHITSSRRRWRERPYEAGPRIAGQPRSGAVVLTLVAAEARLGRFGAREGGARRFQRRRARRRDDFRDQEVDAPRRRPRRLRAPVRRAAAGRRPRLARKSMRSNGASRDDGLGSRRPGHDVGRWKALLVAFTLLSISAMAIEGVATVAAFERGVSRDFAGVSGTRSCTTGSLPSSTRILPAVVAGAGVGPRSR